MLRPDRMDARPAEHFRFEAHDDVDGVLSTLTEDAGHDIVGWPPGPSRGREAARAFHDALFADLAEGKLGSVRRLFGGNFIVDETIWGTAAPGRPFGCEGRGRPLEFRLLYMLGFNEDGRIASENVWVDTAAIQAQQPA